MKKIIIPISIALMTLFSSCNPDEFLNETPTEDITTEDINYINNPTEAQKLVTGIYNKLLDWNVYSFSWIGATSIISDEADKGSDPGDTGSDKQLMDALTFNASSGSFRDIFESRYEIGGRANVALQLLPKLDKVDAIFRNQLIGEAKFLRALAYFDLVRCFGGVPIVDETVLPTDKATLLTRKSAAEVYAFIEKDLTEAAAVLPATASANGKATKGAAYALLAKVALYQKKWADVVTYANQVTGYSLVSNYQDNFKTTTEFNSESIFEVNGAYGVTTSKGIAGYSATQGARGAWGWGFNTPTSLLQSSYETGDVRKEATIIIKGQTLYDGRVVPTTVANERYNYKAYSPIPNTDAWESDINLKILRYAEVLLMLAEAKNELGETTAAAGYLNQVRKRAGLANTTATSQADMRTAIQKERRLELAMEHNRWFDLVRTGTAKAAMALDGKTFVEGKHELFPIPESFMTDAKDYSTQNPGY